MGEIKKRLPLQCPALPLLARLSEKEQQFVLDFVKSSGSLKDMAKNIGVSYPTVRNILDDLIEKLTKMDV